MDKKDLLKLCVTSIYEVTPLIRRSVRKKFREHGDAVVHIPPGQLNCMYLINKGLNSISKLAKGMKVSAPTVSRQVDTLVEKGFVTRDYDPEDRRQMKLNFTEKGQYHIDQTMQVMETWMSDLLSGLDDEQLSNILTSLNLLDEVFYPEGGCCTCTDKEEEK